MCGITDGNAAKCKNVKFKVEFKIAKNNIRSKNATFKKRNFSQEQLLQTVILIVETFSISNTTLNIYDLTAFHDRIKNCSKQNMLK